MCYFYKDTVCPVHDCHSICIMWNQTILFQCLYTQDTIIDSGTDVTVINKMISFILFISTPGEYILLDNKSSLSCLIYAPVHLQYGTKFIFIQHIIKFSLYIFTYPFISFLFITILKVVHLLLTITLVISFFLPSYTKTIILLISS